MKLLTPEEEEQERIEDAKARKEYERKTGIRPDDGPCERRFKHRVSTFKEIEKSYPRLKHRFYWLLHNCVAHPALGILPNWKAIEFHQLTSIWLNSHLPPRHSKWKAPHNYETILIFTKLDIKDKAKWMLHNCVAHVAIGLFPCRPTFKFHDWSAKYMDVEGWE